MANPRPVAPADRRVHPRNDYGGTLQVQLASGGGTWFPVHGNDVSAGGFSFYSEVPLERGERLDVAVPEIDVVTFAATVRHVRAAAPGAWFVGVEFDEPLPESVARCLCRW